MGYLEQNEALQEKNHKVIKMIMEHSIEQATALGVADLKALEKNREATFATSMKNSAEEATALDIANLKAWHEKNHEASKMSKCAFE